MKLEDTPTPITDAVTDNADLCDQCVPAEFARDLERKLAVCRDALTEIRSATDGNATCSWESTLNVTADKALNLTDPNQ